MWLNLEFVPFSKKVTKSLSVNFSKGVNYIFLKSIIFTKIFTFWMTFQAKLVLRLTVIFFVYFLEYQSKMIIRFELSTPLKYLVQNL